MNRATALKLLNLSESEVTPAVIRARRRTLLAEHHPDKGGDVATFHAIAEAADFLLQDEESADLFGDIFDDIAKKRRAL